MCPNSSVQNSIAAGNIYGGFIAPGHDCGDTSSVKFKNNIGHSNDGDGAYIFPDPASNQSGNCYEVSNFSAYKNKEVGVTTHYQTKELRARDLVMIDNSKGISLQTAGEGDSIKIRAYDIEIFGEGDQNEDCPSTQSCSCKDKFGLMLFGNN